MFDHYFVKFKAISLQIIHMMGCGYTVINYLKRLQCICDFPLEFVVKALVKSNSILCGC